MLMYNSYFADFEGGYAFYGLGVDGEKYIDHSAFRAMLRLGFKLNFSKKE